MSWPSRGLKHAVPVDWLQVEVGACGERGLQMPVPKVPKLFNPNQWDSKVGEAGRCRVGANDALAGE